MWYQTAPGYTIYHVTLRSYQVYLDDCMMQWLILSSRMSHNILYNGLDVDRYLCSDTPRLWRLLERIQTLQKFVESFSPLLCLWDDAILPPVERGLQQLQRVGKTQNTEGQGRHWNSALLL